MTQGPPESLQVDFDPVSTDRALRQAGLSLWGSNRPALLGWWLNDSVDGSSLVGDGQSVAEPLRRRRTTPWFAAAFAAG